MSSWNLRDEFIRAIDHWYLILGFIVLGGLLGYIISSILPAPFRATADLYVGIDVTRVNEMEYLIPFAKEEPLNLDDYKNWQLKQLADLFYSDRVLEAALASLQEKDQNWESVTLADFRKHLDIYWYDTGIWRLEYFHSDPKMAEDAVQAWLDAGYAYITDLLAYSEKAARLDAEIEINKDASTALKIQAARIKGFLESAAAWLEDYSSLDPSSQLSVDETEELSEWVTTYLADPDIGQIFPADFPQQGAPAADYRNWLEDASAQGEAALDELEQQLNILARGREDLLPEYHQSLDDSQGLSANIVLRENSSLPQVSPIRNQGTSTLASAGLGLLGWLIFAVIQIRGQHED